MGIREWGVREAANGETMKWHGERLRSLGKRIASRHMGELPLLVVAESGPSETLSPRPHPHPTTPFPSLLHQCKVWLAGCT